MVQNIFARCCSAQTLPVSVLRADPHKRAFVVRWFWKMSSIKEKKKNVKLNQALK